MDVWDLHMRPARDDDGMAASADGSSAARGGARDDGGAEASTSTSTGGSAGGRAPAAAGRTKNGRAAQRPAQQKEPSNSASAARGGQLVTSAGRGGQQQYASCLKQLLADAYLGRKAYRRLAQNSDPVDHAALRLGLLPHVAARPELAPALEWLTRDIEEMLLQLGLRAERLKEALATSPAGAAKMLLDELEDGFIRVRGLAGCAAPPPPTTHTTLAALSPSPLAPPSMLCVTMCKDGGGL